MTIVPQSLHDAYGAFLWSCEEVFEEHPLGGNKYTNWTITLTLPTDDDPVSRFSVVFDYDEDFIDHDAVYPYLTAYECNEYTECIVEQFFSEAKPNGHFFSISELFTKKIELEFVHPNPEIGFKKTVRFS